MLRRGFFLLLIAVVFSGLTGCAEKKPYDLEIQNAVLDFGTVDEGTKVDLAFKLKNNGREKIEIKLIRPSCGCTLPGVWDKVIKSGKTGQIPVTFNTSGYNGKVSKVVYVDTNVPEKATLELTITGTVYNPVKINPINYSLGDITDETKPLQGSYEIKNNLDTPLKITEILAPDHTTYNLVTIKPDEEYKLEFTVNPPFIKYEAVSKTFTLKFENAKIKPKELTYSYFLPPPIQVNPEKVEIFLDKENPTRIERRVNIKSNISAPIRLLDLQFNGKGIEYSIIELLKDQFYQILLVVPENYTFPANQKKFTLSFRVENDPRALLYKISVEESEDKISANYY